MAEVKGVSIATTTVKELKKEIADLKNEISALALTDSDYSKQAADLTAKQLQLSKATEMTRGAVIGVNNSYAQLVAETNKLRKEWRSVDMGSERFKELAAQINENNNRLKEMDASIGDNFRNVGNYTESFSKALGSLGSQFPSVQSGINGVQKGFNLLNKNPILFTITAIVTIIQKVVSVMKQSEEGTKALSAIMGAFDGVLTMVTKGFELLGKGIAWVVEKVVDLTAKWFGENEVMKENIQIREDEIALEVLHRENLVKTAKIENEISELRAKSADKIKYSAQERIDFLERAMNKELLLMRMVQEEAQKEYELIALKNKQTQSGTADLEAEARAQAEVIKAQTAYNNKLREYNAQLTEAKRSLGVKGKTEPLEGGDIIDTASIESEIADIIKAEEKAVSEMLDSPRKALEAQKEALAIEGEERLRYAEIAEGTEEQKARAIYSIQQQLLSDELALLQEGLDNFTYFGDERVKAEQRVAQIQRDLAYNTAQYEQQQARKTKEEKVKSTKGWINVAVAGAQAMSSILGNVADMYEEEGEANEESLKKAKNLRIAGATMDMLGGITAAIAGAFTTKTGPWDFVLAGIQAATILASGLANIAQIRKTDTSGNSSVGSSGNVSALVNAPAVVQQVPITRTLTGVAEQDELNKSQRVYVVYDDIKQAGRKVETTESEATF